MPASAPVSDSDARLAPLTATLAARLRAACQHWSAAEFDALVHQIAERQLRWAETGDGA